MSERLLIKNSFVFKVNVVSNNSRDKPTQNSLLDKSVPRKFENINGNLLILWKQKKSYLPAFLLTDI
jgi:hypothetical protein